MKQFMKTGLLATGLISFASMSFAIDANDLIARMQANGYKDVEVSKTLFGNTRITGLVNGREHEFILSKSGTVLRETLDDGDTDHSDGFNDDNDNSWREKADADDSWDDEDDAKYEKDYSEVNDNDDDD